METTKHETLRDAAAAGSKGGRSDYGRYVPCTSLEGWLKESDAKDERIAQLEKAVLSFAVCAEMVMSGDRSSTLLCQLAMLCARYHGKSKPSELLASWRSSCVVTSTEAKAVTKHVADTTERLRLAEAECEAARKVDLHRASEDVAKRRKLSSLYRSVAGQQYRDAVDRLTAARAARDAAKLNPVQRDGVTSEPWPVIRERIRAAGGDAWDKIGDPDAFIREMRGDDPLEPMDFNNPTDVQQA